jgi:tetratricopeptide (TPR) repeat protein
LNQNAGSPDTALRPATIAVALAGQTQDPQQMEALLSPLEALAAESAGRTKSRYALLLAQVNYHLRRISNTEALLADLASSNNLEGPVLHRLHLSTGIASCHISRGQYRESLPHFEEALRLARGSGAVQKEVGTLSNIGVVYYRLGAHSRARPYARAALAISNRDTRDLAYIGAIGVDLCCTALSGSPEEVARGFNNARTASKTDLTGAVASHCYYWLAEALWLYGEMVSAIQEAKVGLSIQAPEAPALLGIVARWCSIVAYAGGSATPPMRLLNAIERIEEVDMFDRLEIGLGVLRFPKLSLDLRAAAEAAVSQATSAMTPESARESYRFFSRSGATPHLPQHPHPAT